MVALRTLLITVVVVFPYAANAGSIVYVVTGSQQFGTADLGTGAFHQISTTPEPPSNLVTGGPNGSLYTLMTASGSLASIDPVTGVTTVIGPTGLGANAFDLARVNGQLYLTDFSSNLYKVNPATGSATLIGATGMPPDPTIPFTTNPDGTINLADESLYPFGGMLYATFDAVTVDPSTFALQNVVVAPNLYRIDPSTGKAALIAPTALNLGASVALDGTFYAFHLGSQVVTLNLSNGNTHLLTDIDPAAGLILGAAPVPTPEPRSVGLVLVGVAALATRRRRATRSGRSRVERGRF